jgi:hypothetical protein
MSAWPGPVRSRHECVESPLLHSGASRSRHERRVSGCGGATPAVTAIVVTKGLEGEDTRLEQMRLWPTSSGPR